MVMETMVPRMEFTLKSDKASMPKPRLSTTVVVSSAAPTCSKA